MVVIWDFWVMGCFWCWGVIDRFQGVWCFLIVFFLILVQSLYCIVMSLIFWDFSCQVDDRDDYFVLCSIYFNCGMKVMENVVSNEVRVGVGEVLGQLSWCFCDFLG